MFTTQCTEKRGATFYARRCAATIRLLSPWLTLAEAGPMNNTGGIFWVQYLPDRAGDIILEVYKANFFTLICIRNYIPPAEPYITDRNVQYHQSNEGLWRALITLCCWRLDRGGDSRSHLPHASEAYCWNSVLTNLILKPPWGVVCVYVSLPPIPMEAISPWYDLHLDSLNASTSIKDNEWSCALTAYSSAYILSKQFYAQWLELKPIPGFVALQLH